MSLSSSLKKAKNFVSSNLTKKLDKLTIIASDDGKLSANQSDDKKIIASYNPERLQFGYHAEYHEVFSIVDAELEKGTNQSTGNLQIPRPKLASDTVKEQTRNDNLHFIKSHPSDLTLDLIFDSSLKEESIEQDIIKLIDLCGFEKAKTSYLFVLWGEMEWNNDGYFVGKPKDISVNYTLFNQRGAPLRANVTLTLIASNIKKIMTDGDLSDINKSSQKVIRFSYGSTLAHIAATVASVGLGIGLSYLDIANKNNADTLTSLLPGSPISI